MTWDRDFMIKVGLCSAIAVWVVAIFLMCMTAIWGDDIRWIATAAVTFMCGIVPAVAAAIWVADN